MAPEVPETPTQPQPRAVSPIGKDTKNKMDTNVVAKAWMKYFVFYPTKKG